MPWLHTTSLGELEYPENAVFSFPSGLPGFDRERRFVFLERPHTSPLIFMHSLDNPDLCFILLPILVVAPEFQISLSSDELVELRFPPDYLPQIGGDVLCAAIVCAGEGEESAPTANLLAPIIVNLRERIGLQVIQTQSGYSHRHPLALSGELCS